MVENQIKNYFDFLFYIGVTSDETSSKIIELLSSKYNNISNQEKDINNLLASLTCDYFKSLDKKQLELIGKNIYRQYLNNKFLSELKTIKKLLIIRYNFFKRKKKKFFNKWRLSTINYDQYNYYSFLNKNNSVKSLQTRTNSKKRTISSQHFLDKLDFYNDKKKEKVDKIKLMSEYNITNECTFKPTIKYPYKRSYSKKSFGKNENKNRKIQKNQNDEINYLKQLFEGLINNNYKISERQITNRKNHSPKSIKDRCLGNKNNIKDNHLSKRKIKTSEKKYKNT